MASSTSPLDVLEEEVRTAESIADISAISAQIQAYAAGRTDQIATSTGESAGHLQNLAGKTEESAGHLRDLVTKTEESAGQLKEAIHASGHLLSGTLGVQLRDVVQGLNVVNQTFGRVSEILCRSDIDQKEFRELRRELIGLIEKDCHEPCNQMFERHNVLHQKLEALESDVLRHTDHAKNANEHLQRLQRQQETGSATVQNLRAELIGLVEKECGDWRQLRAEHAELSRKFTELEAAVRQRADREPHEAAHPPGSPRPPRTSGPR